MWLTENGDPAESGANRFEVRSFAGSEHCGWQSVVFLSVAWPLGSTYVAGSNNSEFRQYVRDVNGVLGRRSTALLDSLALDTELPAGSVFTGYRSTAGAELWLGPDRGAESVYVVWDDQRVERWPRAEPLIACA